MENSFHGPKKCNQVSRVITALGRQTSIPWIRGSVHTTSCLTDLVASSAGIISSTSKTSAEFITISNHVLQYPQGVVPSNVVGTTLASEVSTHCCYLASFALLTPLIAIFNCAITTCVVIVLPSIE